MVETIGIIKYISVSTTEWRAALLTTLLSCHMSDLCASLVNVKVTLGKERFHVYS